MKKKTKKVIQFIKDLHNAIVNNPQFRKDVSKKSETAIQAEIRPLILSFLENYFKDKGYKDYVAKANKSFYWEGEEGKYGIKKKTVFASRSYPDFIIQKPFLIAVEYKKAGSGSIVKQALSQAMIHTLSEEFDFSYVLFHDESSDKRIKKSIDNSVEKKILNLMLKEFNVFVEII